MVFPVGVSRSTDGLGEQMSLSKTSGFLVSRGKTSHFSVLVHWVADPLYHCVSADGFVEGVNADHLEVLISTVLTHPVTVQYT